MIYFVPDYVLENMMSIIEEENEGNITFEKFMEMIDRLETVEAEESSARDAFNAFDIMGRGWVESTDVREALMFVMEKSTKVEKEAVVRHFKLEPNRKIYFREFQDMVTLRKYS